MKLKYIFASIVATLALAVSCEKEADHYLDEIKLSTSYVSLPVAGGAVDVTVVANDAITVGETPDWLTVSVATGMGAEGKIRFEAGPGEGRTAEVKLTCGGAVQRVNVIQGIATVSTATCAEVIAGPDAKTYRVTGVCKNIYNTQYGNWHLDDGTGDITIYGTLDAKGNTKNFLSLGIEEGDEVTVEGPKTTYNGTVELVDVTVIKINKSLIKVESIDPEDGIIAKEGGDLVVTLANKGNNLGVEIAEADQAWLGISALDGDVVTLHAAANEGGDRDATVVFKTTDGKKNYTANLTLTQKGAIINATVEEFIAAPVGTVQYRVSGVISKVVNATYGNVNIKDYTGEVYVYGIGAKGDFDKLGLKEGDVVTLVGQRGEYNGPQMVKAVHESSISVTEADIPTVLTATDGVWYRVSGTITKIDNPTYGNMTITDGTNELFIYGVYPGYGATGDARKGLVDKLGIKEGDIITVFGEKNTNKGNPQIKNGVYWSHVPADAGEGGEGGDEATGAYVQVTSAPTSWAGKYLIVWDNEAHGTANNKDLAKTVDVTVTEGVIAASATVDAAAVTVAAVDGGYSIALGSGKFLTFTAASNQCTFADAAAPMNFEYTETGIKVFGVDANSETRYLMKNPNGSNDPVYRGYRESSFIKEGTWQEGWAYPTLYKYVEAN
ncbi:MAG: BACON domain-containing protein [Bacteroidales bacterium]|nr:BACON domain-containing protein [Bacteroidales bacterium]